MEYVPQAEKDKWSDHMLDKYAIRAMVNDICAVRPNNFIWAPGELPNVVKVPSLDFEDAKYLFQSDYESYVYPFVKVTDFYTREQLVTLSSEEKETLLTSKLADISSLLIKDLTSLEEIPGTVNSEVIVKSRNDLCNTVSIHKIEFEITLTDLSTVKVSAGMDDTVYRKHRFKYEGKEIIDKYLDTVVRL